MYRSKLKSNSSNLATNSPIITSSTLAGINSKSFGSKTNSLADNESGNETLENDTENEENLDQNQRSHSNSNAKNSALLSKNKYISTQSSNIIVRYFYLVFGFKIATVNLHSVSHGY
jgi:hypothetical protein